MVIKGSARGGASSLAAHLERTDTNEIAEVRELRGVIAGDLHGALSEMEAVASGARSQRYFYHASINTRADEVLTPEQWTQAINRLEKELDLAGQPRAVVAHVKEGRAHVHIAWSRIDLETMKAIPDSHNYRRHEIVARELEQEFGHARVQGAHIDREGQKRPDRTPSHAEMQQAERTGLTSGEAKAQLTEIWNRTDSGKAFLAATTDAGWTSARGDRRDIVMLDPHGETHSLARRIEGAKAKDIRARMADVDPVSLPSVDEARAQYKARAKDLASEAMKRGEMYEPSEDLTKQQPKREAKLLEQAQEQEQKLNEFKKGKEAEAEEAKKHAHENEGKQSRASREGDISDASTRYSIALGKSYNIKDPYTSLAEAAAAEGASFAAEQQKLRQQAAVEPDAGKRHELDLRRRIEACEYMSVTTTRIAGIGATIAGREDAPDVMKDRERVVAWNEMATKYRDERAQLQADRDKKERDTAGDQASKPREGGEKEKGDRGAETTDARAEKVARAEAKGRAYQQENREQTQEAERGRE